MSRLKHQDAPRLCQVLPAVIYNVVECIVVEMSRKLSRLRDLHRYDWSRLRYRDTLIAIRSVRDRMRITCVKSRPGISLLEMQPNTDAVVVRCQGIAVYSMHIGMYSIRVSTYTSADVQTFTAHLYVENFPAALSSCNGL